jgi:hypothetical protein
VENTQESGVSSLRETLGYLSRCRTYRLLTLFLIMNGFVQYGLIQWWPSFYVRVFALSSATAGLYLGLAIGVGSAVGMLMGGVLATKAAQRDVTLPLKMGMGTIALTILTTVGSILIPSVGASICFVAGTMMLLNAPFGAIAASIFSVVKPRVRAMAGAVALFATSLLGMGLGPWCVGVLSDLIAPSLGVQSLRYALFAPIGVLPAMVILLRAAVRTLSQDLQAVSAK